MGMSEGLYSFTFLQGFPRQFLFVLVLDFSKEVL